MPVTSLALSPAVADAPSAAVQAVIDAITLETGALAKTVSPNGGVQVERLQEVVDPIAEEFRLVRPTGETFAANELVWEDTSRAIAVGLQAGRAATNNGALLSVLAAASRPRLDWLILVLPERYKGSSTYATVLKQLSALQDADGIHLDLAGVTVIGF